MSTSLWEINLLGALSAQREGQLLTRFKTRKTAALLGLMAARPHRPHRREEVIALLWPDAEEESGRNRLRLALSDLHKQLDSSAPGDGRIVVADRLQVQLSAKMFRTDLSRFEALLEQARKTNDDAFRIDCLTQAVELYRGDLLEGFDEEWILGERQRLLDTYLLALRRLIKALAVAHQYDRALHYARRAVEADPLREEAHRALMQLYAGMGRPAEALRQFRQMERLLREELNVAPSAQSRQQSLQLLPSSASPVEIVRSSHASVPTASGTSACAHPATSPDTSPPLTLKASSPLAVQAAVPGFTPNALPTYDTRLAGRQHEVEQVCEMLLTPDTRLVSITGLGGCGKTRVAVQAAQALSEKVGGRIAFVPLAAVQNTGLLWDAVAQALRLRSETDSNCEAQVLSALDGPPTLLLLDNAEPLGEAGSLWIAELLERAPALLCLVTSRQRLNISREYEYGLLPLSLPATNTPATDLLDCPSVQVFLDRARRVRASFTITPDNAEAIAAVCRHVEGLPLALELAAAWTRMLTPAQIQARLAQRFTFLVSRAHDAPARHRSLQAVLDNSFQRLCPEVQRFFARLSVFRGGWTLEGAEFVCGEANALEYLTQLRDWSLLTAQEQGEQMRYTWLETVREYAAERLEVEELAQVQQQHADFYRGLCESFRPHLVGAETVEAQAVLETEESNLRAALGWGMAHAPEGAYLANSLASYWYVRGRFQEASDWFAQALQTPEALPSAVCLHTTGNAGDFAYLRTDYAEAHVHFTACLTMARQANDPYATPHALDSLGNVTQELGDHQQAECLLEESIRLWRTLEQPRYLALALSHRAILAEEHGELKLARCLYEESLALYRRARQQAGISLTLCHLADVLLKSGEIENATPLLEESLILSRRINSPRNLALTLGHLAHLSVLQGRFDCARQSLAEAIQTRDKAGITVSPQTLAFWQDITIRIAQVLGTSIRYEPGISQPTPFATPCLPGGMRA